MVLNFWPFALMLAVTILYGSSLASRLVMGFWGAFLVAAFVVGNVLGAFGIALILKLVIALFMLVKGRMGSSSFR